MWSLFLRLGLAVSVMASLAIVAARQVGAQRPRDWLAVDVLSHNARTVLVTDIPLRLQFDVARLIADRDAPCAITVPAWSHDGRLALGVFCGDDTDIFVVDFRTLAVSNFSDDPALDYHPVWSTDGRIAFVSDRDGFYYMYIGDPATGEITRVSEDYVQVRPAVWSSDGKLAFSGYLGTGVSGYVTIFVRDLDGSVRRVGSTFPNNAPTWSPDGSRMVYAMPTERGTDDLFLLDMNSDGEPRNLTRQPSIETAPYWLPDGRLAYLGYQGRRMDIYLMDVDTGAAVNVTDDAADNSSASWSNDGQSVSFISFLDGSVDLFTMDLKTGVRTRLSYKQQIFSPAAWAR